MAEFHLAVSIINITKHEKIIRRTTEQNIEIFCLLGINTEKPNVKGMTWKKAELHRCKLCLTRVQSLTQSESHP